MKDSPSAANGEQPGEAGVRLDSWKEIAAHLGRDVSTVQRWEKREGMPVHRHVHAKRGSVYAFAAELDAWLHTRKPSETEASFEASDTPVPANGAAARRSWSKLLAAAAALVVIALAAAAYMRGHRAAEGEPVRIASVAVLPLQDLSGDKSQDYFADGMTDALIGRLSAIRGVRNISRTSVMQFKGRGESIREIAKILRVDAVVEGTIVRDGNRVRVTAQLVRGDTEDSIWSAAYERELSDVLTLESELATTIADRIAVVVTGAERSRLQASRVVAPEVYETYLKGRFKLYTGTKSATEESVRYFETAIASDPSFAPAHAGLAAAYNELSTVLVGAPPREIRPRAIAAANKAIELDPELAEAHAVLGSAYTRELRWAEAKAAFEHAISLNPGDANAHAEFANWLVCHGRKEEAIGFSRRARDLDPLSLRVGAALGWILYQSRRYDESVRELRSILTIDPAHPQALWYLSFALVETAHFDEAVRILERMATSTDRAAGPLGMLTRAYAGAGRRQDGLQIINELKGRQATGFVPAGAFVNAYMGLGDHEQALVWLERGYQERTAIMQFLKVHPVFDPLRGDPRFVALLHRTGLD